MLEVDIAILIMKAGLDRQSLKDRMDHLVITQMGPVSTISGTTYLLLLFLDSFLAFSP